MRIRYLLTISLMLMFLFFNCAGSKYAEGEEVVELDVKFVDPIWDGNTIPIGQGCNSCGENGATPRLIIKGIPEQANALIMTYEKGRHPLKINENFVEGTNGVIGYRITPGKNEVVVPSVSGNTNDLPENFFIVKRHQAKRNNNIGAYLPPCSCDTRASYFVQVKAVNEIDFKENELIVLGEAILFMGVDK